MLDKICRPNSDQSVDRYRIKTDDGGVFHLSVQRSGRCVVDDRGTSEPPMAGRFVSAGRGEPLKIRELPYFQDGEMVTAGISQISPLALG